MIDRPEKDSAPSRLPVGVWGSAVTVVSLVVLAGFVLVVTGLLAADIAYLGRAGVSFGDFLRILGSPEVRSGIWLSVQTSLVSLLLVVLVAVPVGYGLSRLESSRGALLRVAYSILNAVIDVPIVLPPVVIGLSLLAFFGTAFGEAIREALKAGGLTVVSGIGIVLCQFLVSISYCVRAVKASFDSVDRRLEAVAMSLGLTPGRTFWSITLPLSVNGLIAGAVMAWARSIGVFGPLMVFVGTSPRVQVMPTAMWLELSIGNIEVSLAIALVAVSLSGLALVVVHLLAPGKQWT